MDTRLLEYFVATAEDLNVTQAASRLYAAQSTVSAGLRSLERDLGVTLFKRTTRSIEITPEGELLLPAARDVLEATEDLRALSSQTEQGQRGRLRLGTFSSLEFLDLPAILGSFRQRYPRLDLLLTASQSGSSGLLEDVQAGRLDVAFVGTPPPSDLDSWELTTVPYVAVVPPQDPLARCTSVSLADLAGHPWVEVLPGFGNRTQVEAWLTERGLTRRIAALMSDLPSVPRYVAQGLGVAVIPHSVPTDGCAVLPLRDVDAGWTLSLVTRAGAFRRPHIKALIEEILDARLQHPFGGPDA